jgi:diguanylate cyclase (GGDEF)-like protein
MDQQSETSIMVDDQIVADSLRVIARFTRSLRVHLAFLHQDWRRMRTIYTWPDPEIGGFQAAQVEGTKHTGPASKGSVLIQKLGPDLWMQSGWWLQQLRQVRYIHYEDIDALPPEVRLDVLRLKAEGVDSIGILAVFDGKRLAGILRLDNPRPDRLLNGMDVDLLQIASTLILQVVRATVDLKDLRSEKGWTNNDLWHDEHTDRPTRLLLLELFKEVSRHRGQLYAVMLVELDCFSLIEQRYGKEVGQRLFQMVLERIHAGLRAADKVVRLEDDQICILLVDFFEHDYAETVAQRVLEVFHTPFRINGKNVGMTACIGAAFPGMQDAVAEVILQEAEIALRQARRSGNTRFMAFDDNMRERLLNRLELEHDLRGSLEQGNLLLHYQPITALDSGKLVGFEALVRWNHPTRGLIWPIEFIRLSEDTGLIVPLGLWVLREACQQMRAWQESFRADPPLVISVNISARQLEKPDFPDQVAQILSDTGLQPNCLRLEITENVVVENSCDMLSCLQKLRELGAHLYIDDFGTGYSSLGYLDSLPADAIKIDRSFVNNLGRAKSSLGVIQAILQLARELNIDVVAEGVETSEQHEELKRLHCKFAQGFYVSQPLGQIAAEAYIRNSS